MFNLLKFNDLIKFRIVRFEVKSLAVTVCPNHREQNQKRYSKNYCVKMEKSKYPQYIAILKDVKPVVIRKNSVLEDWEVINHLRHDIAKLLFQDIDNRVYSYLQCEVELKKLILRIIFGFDCSKLWFNGKLYWSLEDSEECPKEIQFDLEINRMYLYFPNYPMEWLDLEENQVDVDGIEGPVSTKRRIESDKRSPKKDKRVRINDSTPSKSSMDSNQ
ncbi:hypothetical protein TpMuguga_04g00887 [Theileria parva strain Muguga]|uniref:Uncharacterized protein n=1 Tax=Theileria parva TaxID=5875 RepID=Q4N162_THEPA|nr:uncharacterized protein TpMuguga_04g00887 [Theileria parva strain Muguga]EAN32241.1 hypothetical protein TpMuguga_04g00887 [Theileria parva strain Muguga]|eukprot:XP_764524.1 hypothetical protein [Theileria parva strain Muguga]